MNFKKQIKQKLVSIAMLAGKEMNETMIKAYIEALSDLDDENVLYALDAWIKTGRGFPYPADIRNKIMPELTDKDDAQEVANSIIAAISSCGRTNAMRAEEKIGSLGWEVVRRMGGWQRLCEICTNDNESILRAQLRDYAETVCAKAKRGELDYVPELPDPQMFKLVSDTFKKIE